MGTQMFSSELPLENCWEIIVHKNSFPMLMHCMTKRKIVYERCSINTEHRILMFRLTGSQIWPSGQEYIVYYIALKCNLGVSWKAFYMVISIIRRTNESILISQFNVIILKESVSLQQSVLWSQHPEPSARQWHNKFPDATMFIKLESEGSIKGPII